MDEPFSNLDPELKWNLMAEMRDLLKREEKTVVFVTHDREEAFTLADDIALIRDGKLLQSGPAAEVYQSPSSHAVARFFGPVNRIHLNTAGNTAKHEKPTELLVRPEWCELAPRNGETHPNTPADRIRIAGSVRRSRFLGEYWEVEVIADSPSARNPDRLVVRSKTAHDAGTPVWVVVPVGAEQAGG
jgi:iron(III) transport system ATP-binding protein